MKKTVMVDINLLDETIEDAIKELSKYVGMNGTIEAHESWGSIEVSVSYEREETGPEQSQRIKGEQYKAERSREKRKEDYEKLKQEFEPLLVR